MAQKRKPNIVKKPIITEAKKTETVVSKPETVKQYSRPRQGESKSSAFLFGTKNYIIMLAGIACIILGLILMAGGGSKDPNVFNPDIFSPMRLTVAPILILLGFAIEVVAIMLKPKQKSAE